MYYFYDPSLYTSSFDIPSEQNKMDKKSDDQLLIMQAMIESNRKNSNEEMKKIKEDLTELIASMKDKIKI